MAQQPMFVITKSGLTIRLEGIDLAICYPWNYNGITLSIFTIGRDTT
jgi:hypothetical protein